MRSRRYQSSLMNLVSSLKVAAVLLLLFAGSIIWATFAQSYYAGSQNWVNQTFYHTWWFLGIQVLLLINIWTATVRIFQGTWRQLGVIVIHVGVTFLMVGSALTHGWGIVGARVDLWEGESTREALETERFDVEVTLRDKDLKTAFQGTHDSPFFARSSIKKWEIPLVNGYSVRTFAYHPYGSVHYVVKENGGPIDPPGIELRLGIPGMPFQPTKLLSSQAPGDTWSKGSFRVAYRDFDEKLKPEISEKLFLPLLEVHLVHDHTEEAHEHFTATLDPKKKDQVLSLGEYELQWDEFVTTFLIGSDGKPIADDGLWRNPAFIWKWWKKDNPEKIFQGFYFVNHEGFHDDDPFEVVTRGTTFLSGKDLPSLVVMSWSGNQNGVELWQSPFQGCWQRNFFLKDGDTAKTPFNFNGADASLEILRTVPHVQIEANAQPFDDTGVSTAPLSPVIGWELIGELGTLAKKWAHMGERLRFDLEDGTEIDVTLKQKSIPLDFKISLKDVTQLNDPGVDQAATWFSLIEVEGSLGKKEEFRIDMNDPIDYGGFRFFQANYSPPNPALGGAEQSGLMVAKDPGYLLYYVGFLTIVVGMLLNFYCQNFLKRFDKK